MLQATAGVRNNMVISYYPPSCWYLLRAGQWEGASAQITRARLMSAEPGTDLGYAPCFRSLSGPRAGTRPGSEPLVKAGHFDPAKFKDEYELALRKLVKRKAAGKDH